FVVVIQEQSIFDRPWKSVTGTLDILIPSYHWCFFYYHLIFMLNYTYSFYLVCLRHLEAGSCPFRLILTTQAIDDVP
ncbi:MAG: hypothetical protein VX677_13460, partial [Candidatus Poribacteria bacterium]|nr:hypothetical protein [Candidatus Poribacteria bacterium]